MQEDSAMLRNVAATIDREPESQHRFRWRRPLGLQARLYAAFGGISLLVILAATVSLASFYRIDRALTGITEQNVPLVIASLDLSRQAERIIAAAPALLQAESAAQEVAHSSSLASAVDGLNASLNRLALYAVEPEAADSIRRSVNQLRDTLDALKRVVSARLAIDAHKQDLLVKAKEATAALGAVLDPLAKQRDNAGQIQLREMQRDATMLLNQLEEIAAGKSIEHLARSVLQANWSMERLRRARAMVSGPNGSEIHHQLDRLSQLIDGNDGVAASRSVELQMLAAGTKSLEDSAALSNRFAQAVNRLVTVAEGNIIAANVDAKSTQRFTAWALLTVVAVTLLSSFLIVWLYVQRNVIARLQSLSSSMLAIASGELDDPVPAVGDDEIGKMAQALSVFRATAVEVRQSNLREIQAARRRLDDAIANIKEGFVLFDAEDRLVLCNARYRELLYEDCDVPAPGTHYEDILRNALRRGLIADVGDDPEAWISQRLARHRQPVGAHEQRRSSGRWIQVNEHKTEDGGTVATYSDMTEVKQHEMELGLMVDKLRTANEAKSRFIANVSHELRTPLTAILGFARIVQKRVESVIFPRVSIDGPKVERAMAQVRRNVAIMLAEGERLTKMVNEILDLEKIEAGEMVWNIHPMDILAALNQAAAACESLYLEKDLTFTMDLAPELPPVLADRDRVVQVLINLISNAVKFTEQGGLSCRVRIAGEHHVRISVIDTGRGIADDDQGVVFEKFRQVGDTLTDKPSGTGLGLPICREIISHLGGEITVESAVGMGSTFHFTLPIAV